MGVEIGAQGDHHDYQAIISSASWLRFCPPSARSIEQVVDKSLTFSLIPAQSEELLELIDHQQQVPFSFSIYPTEG